MQEYLKVQFILAIYNILFVAELFIIIDYLNTVIQTYDSVTLKDQLILRNAC